jgi:hypothetical protein
MMPAPATPQHFRNRSVILVTAVMSCSVSKLPSTSFPPLFKIDTSPEPTVDESRPLVALITEFGALLGAKGFSASICDIHNENRSLLEKDDFNMKNTYISKQF